MIPNDWVRTILVSSLPGMDPPLHSKYRAPLNTLFSPKAVLAMKDSIRELAAELIDAVRHQGSCEFMTAIAEPLPVPMPVPMRCRRRRRCPRPRSFLL